MRTFTSLLLVVSLLLSALLSSAQSPTFTALTSSQPSVTIANFARSTQSTPSQQCYSYATGALTAQSDVSVILISTGNNSPNPFNSPTAYISLTSTPAPSAGTSNYSITGTGQVLLQTSQTVSSTPVNYLTTAGGTVYACVVNSVGNNFTGTQPNAFTLSFSVTTRIAVSGVQNFSVALPAATANSVQYVAWQFPLEVGTWRRGFYSFGATYTTNAAMSTLSIVNTTSLASPQPAIIWAHGQHSPADTLQPHETVPSCVRSLFDCLTRSAAALMCPLCRVHRRVESGVDRASRRPDAAVLSADT